MNNYTNSAGRPQDSISRSRSSNRSNYASNSPRRATVQLSETVRITLPQHSELLTYLHERLLVGKSLRDQYIETFRFIDREYHAWLLKDKEDNARAKKNALGQGVRAVDIKLSMIFAQLDEAVTYLATLLAPEEAIYQAQAAANKQDVAKGFTALMNQHAEDFSHYRAYTIWLLDCLKYNFGAFGVNWRQVNGILLTNSATGGITRTRGLLRQGNELCNFDPYNLLLDPTVHCVDIAEQGQYFGYVDAVNKFRLERMKADGEIFNCDEFINSGSSAFLYYEMHPIVRDTAGTSTGSHMSGGGTNWVNVFNQVSGGTGEATAGYELIQMPCWVIPAKFGLSKSTDYEIWNFTLGGRSTILAAEPLDNAHALLPICIGQPFEDHFEMQGKSVAERLIPHQQFASHVLNVHQRANRKRLYGLTIFDKNVFPQLESIDDELAGGKISANLTLSAGADIRKHIHQFTDGPDTSGSLDQLQTMNQLMQQIMPTNVQNQVAGLERATQYQAAALVQGANRRNLKIAKVLNSQALNRGRFMMLMNCMEYQDQITILTDGGQEITVNPKEFRSSGLQFSISDGLKGLDRLALVMNMKEMFNSILQSQVAAQQFDVPAMMNYISSLWGDQTDLQQFKIKSPMDQLPPEQRTQALQVYQQFLQQQKDAAKQQGKPGAVPPPTGPQG